MVKISFEDMQMAKFIPYTFTKKDVIGNFINDKQYENWIAGQVRSKKIVKVRNGLYVHVDVSGYPLTTKFELATKIAEDAFVCYHSAFEYFGVAIKFLIPLQWAVKSDSTILLLTISTMFVNPLNTTFKL